ncbi:MAG: hypothetical protein ABR508_10150 [Candidatus Baltobacteraceae bacterium]
MPRIEPLAGGFAVAPQSAEEEWPVDRLPREHPRWVKDALAVSARARALLARILPAAVRVVRFWDHHARTLQMGNRRLSIDVSGSYRME